MGLFSAFTTPAWEKARRRAERAEADSDPAAALRAWREAADAAPDDQRADLAARAEKAAAALVDLNEQGAEDLQRIGQLSQAVERFELALDHCSDEARRAAIRAKIRDIEVARIAAEQADDHGETDAAPPDDEENAFNVLVAAMPDDIAERYHVLGDAFRAAFIALHAGRPDEALAWLVPASASAPDDAILAFETGRALRAVGRNEEAIEALSRAQRLEPAWVDPSLALAEVAWAEERWDLAEDTLQKALDAETGDVRVFAAVMRTAVLTKHPEYGLEAAAVALDAAPMDGRLLLLKGQLLELAGRDDEAARCFETVVARHWRYDAQEEQLIFDRDAAALATAHYLRRGTRLDRAEELCRALIAVAPPAARWAFELMLCEALYKAGKEAEARDLAREVGRRVPAEQRIERLRLAEISGDAGLQAEIEASLPKSVED